MTPCTFSLTHSGKYWSLPFKHLFQQSPDVHYRNRWCVSSKFLPANVFFLPGSQSTSRFFAPKVPSASIYFHQCMLSVTHMNHFWANFEEQIFATEQDVKWIVDHGTRMNLGYCFLPGWNVERPRFFYSASRTLILCQPQSTWKSGNLEERSKKK